MTFSIFYPLAAHIISNYGKENITYDSFLCHNNSKILLHATNYPATANISISDIQGYKNELMNTIENQSYSNDTRLQISEQFNPVNNEITINNNEDENITASFLQNRFYQGDVTFDTLSQYNSLSIATTDPSTCYSSWITKNLYGHSGVLEFNDSDTSNYGYCRYFLPHATNNSFNLEYWILVPNNDDAVSMEIYNSSLNPLIASSFLNGNYNIWMGGSTWNILQPIENNKWYHISIEINRDAKSYTLEINNNLYSETLVGNTINVDRMYISTTDSITSVFYLDSMDNSLSNGYYLHRNENLLNNSIPVDISDRYTSDFNYNVTPYSTLSIPLSNNSYFLKITDQYNNLLQNYEYISDLVNKKTVSIHVPMILYSTDKNQIESLNQSYYFDCNNLPNIFQLFNASIGIISNITQNVNYSLYNYKSGNYDTFQFQLNQSEPAILNIKIPNPGNYYDYISENNEVNISLSAINSSSAFKFNISYISLNVAYYSLKNYSIYQNLTISDINLKMNNLTIDSANFYLNLTQDTNVTFHTPLICIFRVTVSYLLNQNSSSEQSNYSISSMVYNNIQNFCNTNQIFESKECQKKNLKPII